MGDKILIRNTSNNKADPIFKGPYEVVEVKSPNVRVQIGNSFKEIHKNRIKLYHS